MTHISVIDVAIVGGGFAGAAVAYHLAHLKPRASIAVFEPRSFLGGGLAYDDQDPAHRINVPAARMSLLPQDDEHFARWIAETSVGSDDPDIATRDGALYPQRRVFGRYVSAHLARLIAHGRIAHVRSRVVTITQNGGWWSVAPVAGPDYRAKIVVIATTHPAPDVPAALASLSPDPRLIPDALVPGALSTIGRDATVVIVGTGLTMADVVASLDRRGHRGKIVALSRRGLRSRGHAARASEPFGDFTSPAPASALLRKVRGTIRHAAALGLPWQSVIDAVRAHAQTFWSKLTEDEQSRIVRHLRVYWDVHRFRVAPQVEDVIDRRISAGSLEIRASSVVAASAGLDHIALTVRSRGLSDVEIIETDSVVVTTGPAHSKVISAQPYLAGLAVSGRVAADHLGLGLACDAQSRARDASGTAQLTLFVAGPLARAQFGELMGLPQVSAHALSVAERAAETLGDEAGTPGQDIAAAK